MRGRSKTVAVSSESGAHMFVTCKRFYVWLAERARIVIFRFKQAQAIRKARREDTNRYPLW
jgi:hypothetical protein